LSELTIGADDLLARARTEGAAEVSVAETKELLDRGEIDLLLDVRDSNEFQAARIPGAIHAPRGSLEWLVDPASDWRDDRIAGRVDARIVLHCTVGARSLLAAQTLNAMGFRNVASMAGGIDAWAEAGFPVETEQK
jgi:rhodanese-related sulfurtransferase